MILSPFTGGKREPHSDTELALAEAGVDACIKFKIKKIKEPCGPST